MRRRSSVLAVVMAMSLLAAAPVEAYEPPGGGLFNTPRPFGNEAQRWTIVRTVEQAIERAQGPTRRHPKPTITISTYLLDRTVTVDALIAACKRGISVRVILDEDIATAPSRKLVRALNADNVPDANNDGKPDRKPRSGRCGRELRKSGGDNGRTTTGYSSSGLSTMAQLRASVRAPTGNPVTWGRDGSYVKRCVGSCRGRGSGGNVHSKFFMFSRTGQAQHVVMISSSNLNKGGALLGWNDLVVMKEKPKSFEFYQKMHRRMTAERRAGGKLVEVRDGAYVSRFFPMFPAGKKKDPTLRDLKAIRCSGSPLGRTTIHVSMFYWKGTRGQYIATQLLNLSRQGCRVSIIYGAPSIEIAQRLREAARNNLITLYDSRWDLDEDGWNEVRTHAKYVLVKGRYRKQSRAFEVWTGSQNWVNGSLTLSDETTLNISSRPIYEQYLNNWTAIRAHSRAIPSS